MVRSIVYNVTVKIEKTISDEWLTWMQEVHIPDVMKTNCFSGFRLTRIIEEPDDHGIGFAIQYVAPSFDDFQRYQQNFAKALQKEHSDRYQNKYVAFRTLLEIIEEK
jgi:hypothetical protein